jgi:hypothetical protein
MQSPTFSMCKSNSNSASLGRFLEGGELRVCYDTEIEFSAGLTRVRAKTLSRIGSGSRVRSGNQVKAFFLSSGWTIRPGLPGWGCWAIRVKLG